MASVKTARSRPTPVKETGAKFEEGINFFRSDKFDADSYVQTRCSLNEKVRSVRFILPIFFLSFQVFFFFFKCMCVCVFLSYFSWLGGLHAISVVACLF